MVSMRLAYVGFGVFALGTSLLATAQSMRAVERSAPQKVSEEGICGIPIASPDGMWNACVDAFGQVNLFFPVDQPTTNNVFETLVYEASTHSGGLSRRVETSYVVSEGPIVSAAGDSTWTRLTKASGAPMSIEITNRMIDGPTGGVQVQIRCENKGTAPITCKLFYYCDFDISGTFPDDEATPIFEPGTGRLLGIEQIDVTPPNKPLLFGGCPNYKSWEIDIFSQLRTRLDLGTPQLADADLTVPGAADHTCAIAGDEVVLEPGQSTVLEVGIGPAFAKCKNDCPWDCDGSNDGIVGITDFLALLAQWGTPGGSCDKDGGGVGITDFLALLAAWGPCPVSSVKCCLPIDLEAYCQNPDVDPPEACVDAASCSECASLGGLCVEECNLVEQTITVLDENSPSGGAKHTTWTALVCAPKAPCVCGNLVDALFTPATACAVGQGSQVQFGSPEIPPIPADFFGPGSDPFVGGVCLKGEPLGNTPFGDFGEADTLVRRTADPFDCAAPFPASNTIEIEIVELNLVSIDPIVVTFNGGQNPELWDVRVNLSQLPQQPGIMQVQKTHPNGGVFTSQLPVLPQFVFTLVSNPADIRVLDAGLEGIPPILLVNKQPIDWVHDVKLGTLAPEGPPSCFNPGISEDNP